MPAPHEGSETRDHDWKKLPGGPASDATYVCRVCRFETPDPELHTKCPAPTVAGDAETEESPLHYGGFDEVMRGLDADAEERRTGIVNDLIEHGTAADWVHAFKLKAIEIQCGADGQNELTDTQHALVNQASNVEMLANEITRLRRLHTPPTREPEPTIVGSEVVGYDVQIYSDPIGESSAGIMRFRCNAVLNAETPTECRQADGALFSEPPPVHGELCYCVYRPASRADELEAALRRALTWEDRLNSADQLARQGADGLREGGAARLAVQRERAVVQQLLKEQ